MTGTQLATETISFMDAILPKVTAWGLGFVIGMAGMVLIFPWLPRALDWWWDKARGRKNS